MGPLRLRGMDSRSSSTVAVPDQSPARSNQTRSLIRPDSSQPWMMITMMRDVLMMRMMMVLML